MPKIHIDRSITISASAKQIYKSLNDFNKWKMWSPWLITDPEAKVTVAEDGRSYKWDGNRVGSGNMKILNELEDEAIDFELNFIKPWKSTAKTAFHLVQEKDSTKVTWSMDSSLPFFMFWMKKMMTAFVGADYERGLDMLKSFIEEGEVPSKLGFEGISHYEGCKWIGIRTDCSLDNVAIEMQADYGMLKGFMEENNQLIQGNAFTIYHKWNLMKGKVDYTAALPVSAFPDDLPQQFITGTLTNAKAYKLKHTGAYHHLGNAWSAGYAMMRNKEFKHQRNIKPFEVYHNNPNDTHQKDLITVLHFPVK